MQVRGSLYKKEIKGAETHEHDVSHPQTLCGILLILFNRFFFAKEIFGTIGSDKFLFFSTKILLFILLRKQIYKETYEYLCKDYIM